MKKGFTLVELLAVIVILSVILAIAIPVISDIIDGVNKSTFESDAKLVLNAIELKSLEDSSFNPNSVDETTINSLLNLDNSNYEDLTVKKTNSGIFISVIGKNKWNNLIAIGNKETLTIKEDLVLWYNFMDMTNTSENNTIASDLSGNDHDGTLYNFAYTETSGYNDGLNFDGTNDYVYIGDIGQLQITSGTVSFWRKSSSTNAWLILTSNYDTRWIMATHGTDEFYQSNIGSNYQVYIDGALDNTPKTDGKWHYYTITNVNFDTFEILMMNNYNSYQLHGNIGDLKIYNKSYTASQIKEFYNTEKTRYGL